MATRKNIYLYNDNVIKFLESKHNQSKYIEGLIEKDMNHANLNWTKEQIVEIIEDYLHEINYVNLNAKNHKDKEAISSLQNLLNM